MRRLNIILLIVFYCTSHFAISQGCSDAGFCTMGAMRPDQAYSKRIALKLRSIEMNFYSGQSILSPIIYVSTLDATIGLNDKNYVQVKLPYQYAKGDLGSVGGMGDISLSFSRVLKQKNNWSVSGTLGGKIPLGDGNAKVNNEFTRGESVPIHMYYQPSLGSYDVIGGIAFINSKWLFATGIQIPLTENKNQFVWSGFPDFPRQEYVLKYNRGTQLKRGTDVMLRAERNWRFTNWNFSLGALPIWRIKRDHAVITDPERIKQTKGLALSLLASFGYQFDVNNGIKFIYGHKLADRDFNPDGLTRRAVRSVSYIYKF